MRLLLYNFTRLLILFIFGCDGSSLLLWLFPSCSEPGLLLVAASLGGAGARGKWVSAAAAWELGRRSDMWA